MKHIIEDTVQTAILTGNPDHHAHAVEQIRAGVTLGFIRDFMAAEYVYLLQHGMHREVDVTYPKIHRIPEAGNAQAPEQIAA